jgi:hypothetical protein
MYYVYHPTPLVFIFKKLKIRIKREIDGGVYFNKLDLDSILLKV